MMIAALAGLSNVTTIVISVVLAFIFGYSLSVLPVVESGVALRSALALVLAADTLSITVMEIVDNSVVALIPNALNATLINPLFWISLSLSLVVAFYAAYSVNKYLISRGKGHALMHGHH